MKRSALMPDLPTMDESGLPGFAVGNWAGLLGPAGLDAAIVTKLHGEVIAILGTADMKERIKTLGFDVIASTPAEFAKQLQEDVERWGPVAKAASEERKSLPPARRLDQPSAGFIRASSPAPIRLPGEGKERNSTWRHTQKLLNSVVPAETSGSAKKHSSTSGSLPVLRVMCFSFGGISTMSPGLIGISPLSATVMPVPLST